MSSPHPRPLSKVEGGGDFYAETSAVLQGYGIRVIRIPNEEVFNNKENILQKIVVFSSPHSPLHFGEGLG